MPAPRSEKTACQSPSVAYPFRHTRRKLRIEPTDRRAKAEWTVTPEDANGAEDGEVVRAEPLPGKPLGLKPARVIERLGQVTDARAVSLIVIATHDIPTEFTPVSDRRGREGARDAAE